jgi:hypothetical protein
VIGIALTRYRLRFLLQEIDLPQGETLIGRSPACHVSIEDPLVSRQHARLRIQADRATIEDLGSRNGLQVGGRSIEGICELSDGDRIRIGTQELVFCKVSAPSRHGSGPGTRPTGFMTHCAECALTYPAELLECPSCGSRARVDEDTLNGNAPQHQWTLQLLLEVLQKARALERAEDVNRTLERAKATVEDCLTRDLAFDATVLDAVTENALWAAGRKRDLSFVAWALSVYAAKAWVPSRVIVRSLTELAPLELDELRQLTTRITDAVAARGGPTDAERNELAELAGLERAGAIH